MIARTWASFGKVVGTNIHLSRRQAAVLMLGIVALVTTAALIGFGWARIECGGFALCGPTRELRGVALYFTNILFPLAFFCAAWTMGQRLLAKMYSDLWEYKPGDLDDLDILSKCVLVIFVWAMFFAWFRSEGGLEAPGVVNIVNYLVVGGGLAAWMATMPVIDRWQKRRGDTGQKSHKGEEA